MIGAAAVAGGARRLLIVNADDYGLSAGVCEAILTAHREGIVTSTSVLALGPALARCGGRLREAAGLGIGVHLAAVGEDPPLLAAREIPSLVDRRGRLHRSWHTFVPRAVVGAIDADDLAREFRAQIERVRALGVRPSHLDTHQHLHLLPLVREVVLALAGASGIGGIRVPRSRGRRRWGVVVNPLAAALARRAQAAGLCHPADAVGFDEAGRLVPAELLGAIAALGAAGAPTAEIITHPGAAEDPERGRYPWGYRWAEELAALLDPRARDAVARAGFRLGSYAALAEGPWGC